VEAVSGFDIRISDLISRKGAKQSWPISKRLLRKKCRRVPLGYWT